jgi:hypothetical protein
MSPLRYYSTLSEAIAELERRRKDPELRKRVEDYLEGDVPEHFNGEPILYLARHVATPNQETRVFLELSDHLNFQAVIGQDPQDIFVSNNELKRAFGKLPVVTGTDRNGNELYEYVTVLDFNEAQGKRLHELKTYGGLSLVDFHNDLFDHVYAEKPIIRDEALWIDRQHRGNMLKHYKKCLALYVVHGILFEYFLTFDSNEQRLIAEIIAPAYDHIRETFGVGPLITPPVTPSVELRNWESYPKRILDVAKKHKKS